MDRPAPQGNDAGQLQRVPLSISANQPPAALINFIVAARALRPSTWAAVQDIERQRLKLTDVNGMIAIAARHRARWRPVLARFGWLPTADGRGVINPTMGLACDVPPAALDPECRAALNLREVECRA
ncbi:hypothetical protein [Altererythrobacter lauratis]|uniref:Uncharacterized protein n=1 Tax=Alteraurantiacibacter lauratis TaxID=2054627 RepID=A0ABV7EDD6_9SPHN